MKLPDHVYVFVETYSLFLIPPPLSTISFRAHTYVNLARVRVMLNASRRFLTIACMTSFDFLVSENLNGNTPSKTYTCQKGGIL
jgi:hypothetical protein